MGARRWTADEERTAREMLTAGASYADVGVSLGRTACGIARRCSDKWHLRPLRLWTDAEDREAKRLLAAGLSYGEVGTRLRRHPSLVGKRNRELWRVPLSCHTGVNAAFFEEWSPKMAYVLGFIMADGCLRREGHWVSITQKERQILDDMAEAIGFSGRLYRERRGLYRLEFRSERAWSILYRLGVVPAKAHVLAMCDIPHDMVSHFMRGYLDGDGCIHRRDCGKKPLLGVSIASVSPVFRLQLASLIRHHLGFWCSSSGIEIRITSHRLAMRFLFWLYRDKDASLYLKRKYRVFQKTLDERIEWRRPPSALAS